MASSDSVSSARHAVERAELIHEDARAWVTGYVLEEQRRTAPGLAIAAKLCGAVGDLGHLQKWRDRGAHATQLSLRLKGPDPRS